MIANIHGFPLAHDLARSACSCSAGSCRRGALFGCRRSCSTRAPISIGPLWIGADRLDRARRASPARLLAGLPAPRLVGVPQPRTSADGRDERIDWATQTGQYAYMPIAEEHERLMRGD